MQKTLIKEKLKASLIHAAFTFCIIAIVGACIFYLWYPPPFATIMGGLKLFGLISGVEIILGPLVSFIIYNSSKPKRELLLDYALVLVVQISVLAYGVFTTYQARPLYMIFVKDRFELVTVSDFNEKEIKKSRSDIDEIPVVGEFPPKLLGVIKISDPALREKVLFTSVFDGKDIHQMPQFFTQYNPAEVLDRSQPVPVLLNKLSEKGNPEKADELAENIDDRWVPIMTRFGVWTVILDGETGLPANYIEFNPF